MCQNLSYQLIENKTEKWIHSLYFVEENSFGASNLRCSENKTFLNVTIFMNYNMDQYGQHA